MVHLFEKNDIYFALDGNCGALHVLDKTAYDAIGLLASGMSRDVAHKALSGEIGNADAEELLGEIEALKADGQLFAAPPVLEERPAADEIKALCLHAAHDCDLRCAYCFASTGSFHGGRKLMPVEVGRAALDFLIARSGSRNTLEVDFFGGEPLMNFDMVKETVRYGRELEKRSGKRIRFTLTTNGMGLTDEITAFLNAEMHNVVVSIDGRPEVHDALRKTAVGGGSHAQILTNAQRFAKARGDKSYYIRGTFTNRNLDFANDVVYLLEQGFANVSVEPAVLPEASPLSIGKEHMQAILQEYDKLADDLAERYQRGEAPFFHFNIDFAGGPCAYKRLTGCGAGSEYLAVTPDGDLYPCHQFVGEEQFLLGNVFEGKLDEAVRAPFRKTFTSVPEKCADCWARPWCGGGCMANAWHRSSDVRMPYELECEMEKKRVECAAYLFAMKSSQ